MKKITLLITLCTLSILAMAYPQVLPIDYTQFFATTAIGTAPNLEKSVYLTTGDAIKSNQWNRSGKLSSGEGAGVSPIFENSTLSYSSYIDNNVGKAIILDPNIVADPLVSGSLFRTTIYSLTSSSTDYTGTYYVGMLVNFTTVATSGIDFLAMDANHAGNSQRGRVFVRNTTSAAGYYQMGVGFSGTSDIGATGSVGTWSTDLALGTTYFIVLKYVTAPTNGTEIASLFINPIPGESEAATTHLNNTVSATSSLKCIKGFIIRQRSNMGGKLAGIRFSDNWADIVKSGLTQANAPTIGSASNITATSFTANWTLPSTNNAVSYDILLYQGSTYLSTTNVSNSGTSAVVSGLTSGLTYTYKVVAKGNGTTLVDSNPVTSATFTSAIPSISSATVISGTSFHAVWTPVSNAASYNVLVYQGTDLLSTTSVPGQASSVVPITGLSEGLSYTYKVTTSAGYTSDLSAPFVAINPIVKEIFSDWTDQVAGA